MSHQLSLGEVRPTSREARRDGVASGRIHSNAVKVRNFLSVCPDSTAGELGKWTGLGRVEAARRLSDALKAGRVVQRPARMCKAQGTRQLTWRVAE